MLQIPRVPRWSVHHRLAGAQRAKFAGIAAPYDAQTWSTWTAAVKEATGRKGKGLFMPLRLAVTGVQRGPEMADVMPLLQKKPTL